MIYVGNNELPGVMLGNMEIPGIYVGDTLIYPTTITGLSVSPSQISVEKASGSTFMNIASLSAWTASSSEAWITLSQNTGDSGRTRVTLSYTENTGSSARTATITVTDGSETATTTVTQVLCAPLVLADHLGNTNNQGESFGEGKYLFDAGITVVDECHFDFSGITQLCHRPDFMSNEGSASLGMMPSEGGWGSLSTITDFTADCSTIIEILFPFGNDDLSQASQTLTSVTLYNTENVVSLGGVFKWNANLQSVSLGDMSSVSSFPYHSVVSDNNTALTDFNVVALPDLDITDSNWGFSTCAALSVNSLVNILNALPVTQTSGRYIYLGANKNKLSAAQIAIATNKGWEVR